MNKANIKRYNAPEPWDQMGFYLEIEDIENELLGTTMDVWLCKENLGAKSYLIGCPYQQTDKIWTAEENLELVENMLANDIGYIEGFLEEHAPEDMDEFYELAYEYGFYGFDESDDDSNDEESDCENGCCHDHDDEHYCECCGARISDFDIHKTDIANNILNILNVVNKDMHYSVLEILSGLAEAYNAASDDFWDDHLPEEDTEEFEEYAEKVYNIFMNAYHQENPGELDPFKVAHCLNVGVLQLLDTLAEAMLSDDDNNNE